MGGTEFTAEMLCSRNWCEYLDWILGTGPEAGCCKHGNELSGYTQDEKSLDQLKYDVAGSREFAFRSGKFARYILTFTFITCLSACFLVLHGIVLRCMFTSEQAPLESRIDNELHALELVQFSYRISIS